jgi:mRNA interferase YafQ
MRTIARTTKFKRDYKREKKADRALDDALVPIIELLVADGALPERLRDHALVGDLKGYRDCHVKPDLVLIYAKSDNELTLVRLGSHSELFG